MSIVEIDLETGTLDLTTAAPGVTVLSHTPSVSDSLLVQAFIALAGVDGSGGNFEVVTTIGGLTVQPSPQILAFSTDVLSAIPLWPQPLAVLAGQPLVIKVHSPNAGDSAVDVEASLFDVSPQNAAEINAEVDTALVDYDGATGTDLDVAVTTLAGNINLVANRQFVLETTVAISDTAQSFTLTRGATEDDAFDGMQLLVIDCPVTTSETFESASIEDPFTGTADLTWVGDLSGFEIDTGDWPTGPDFGTSGEKSLRSKPSGGSVYNTVVTDISDTKTLVDEMVWEVFASGDNAAIQVTISIELVMFADSATPGTIESPDEAFQGYKIEITDTNGGADAIRFLRCTSSDDDWVIVKTELFGAPKNVNEGWNLKVTRSALGVWNVFYANGAKGTTPVLFFTVTDNDVNLTGDTWFSGVAYKAPASKAEFCGFDDFSVTGAGSSETRQITEWTSGRVVTLDQALSFTPGVGALAKVTIPYGRNDFLTSGIGAITDFFIVEEDDVPQDGAEVWITTDEVGDNVVAGTIVTQTDGKATFLLDLVNGLWAHAQLSGTNFTGFPRQFNVTAGGFVWV